MQAMRNCPRTGSLPAGKGCFTEPTVASTAERKLWLLPLWARYSLRPTEDRVAGVGAQIWDP